MLKEKKSYNSKLTVMTRQFLLPSWPKILLYLLIGTLLLMLWNVHPLWEQFKISVLGDGNAAVLTNSQPSWLTNFSSHLFNGRLAQVIFWAFAGCAVYVCIWFMINIFSNLRNDFIADDYVHPGSYNRAGYWHSVLSKKIFLVAMVVVLITFVFTSIRIMGLLASVFYSALHNFKLSPGLLEVIATIISVGFLIYLFVLLVHITVNSWRSVYADL